MWINGWLRLWIMATVVWLCIVIFYSWQTWPRPESTTHKNDFLSQVKPQSALLHCPSAISAEECEKSAVFVAKMPNGYSLLFSIPDTNPDAVAAAKSYWQTVEVACKNDINKFVLLMAMAWLGASLAVLLLGFGVVWINRGFRPNH